MWEITTQTVTVFANLLDAEHRKEVSGVVGTSAVANETINEFGATEGFILLAVVSLSLGPDQPLPLPAPRRRPHLLERGRESAGQAGRLQTMERAGAVGFVLVIMLFFLGLSQRHRPADGRRLQRPLARRATYGLSTLKEKAAGGAVLEPARRRRAL